MIVRRDVGQAAFLLQAVGVFGGLVVGIAVQRYIGAETSHRFYFDFKRGLGHDDGGLGAELRCRQRHALRVISHRSAIAPPSSSAGVSETIILYAPRIL